MFLEKKDLSEVIKRCQMGERQAQDKRHQQGQGFLHENSLLVVFRAEEASRAALHLATIVAHMG